MHVSSQYRLYTLLRGVPGPRSLERLQLFRHPLGYSNTFFWRRDMALLCAGLTQLVFRGAQTAILHLLPEVAQQENYFFAWTKYEQKRGISVLSYILNSAKYILTHYVCVPFLCK